MAKNIFLKTPSDPVDPAIMMFFTFASAILLANLVLPLPLPSPEPTQYGYRFDLDAPKPWDTQPNITGQQKGDARLIASEDIDLIHFALSLPLDILLASAAIAYVVFSFVIKNTEDIGDMTGGLEQKQSEEISDVCRGLDVIAQDSQRFSVPLPSQTLLSVPHQRNIDNNTPKNICVQGNKIPKDKYEVELGGKSKTSRDAIPRPSPKITKKKQPQALDTNVATLFDDDLGSSPLAHLIAELAPKASILERANLLIAIRNQPLEFPDDLYSEVYSHRRSNDSSQILTPPVFLPLSHQEEVALQVALNDSTFHMASTRLTQRMSGPQKDIKFDTSIPVVRQDSSMIASPRNSGFDLQIPPAVAADRSSIFTDCCCSDDSSDQVLISVEKITSQSVDQVHSPPSLCNSLLLTRPLEEVRASKINHEDEDVSTSATPRVPSQPTQSPPQLDSPPTKSKPQKDLFVRNLPDFKKQWKLALQQIFGGFGEIKSMASKRSGRYVIYFNTHEAAVAAMEAARTKKLEWNGKKLKQVAVFWNDPTRSSMLS